VRARFYDGRTAQAREVELTLADGRLAFDDDDRPHRWPVRDIADEDLGGIVRLSCATEPAARLMVEAAVWRALRGHGPTGADKRRRREERRLVVGLSAVGGLILFLVFVVLPAASGPLARATPPALEQRLGESFEAQLTTAMRPCRDLDGQALLYRFGDRFESLIDGRFNIRVRAIEAPFANAFALPGGAVLVTDDLIRDARTPDELSAVIAHEVAHVERRHVMQATWRAFGLGLVLDTLVGGGSGAGQQAVLLAGSATNLRFSRKAEAEADLEGVALLKRLRLSSLGMATFFDRLAVKEPRSAVGEFLSNHPSSARRAAATRALGRPGVAAFTPEEWAKIKQTCSSGADLRFAIPPLVRR